MVFATWRNNRNDTVNVFGSVYGRIINGETICRVGRNTNKSLYQTSTKLARIVLVYGSSSFIRQTILMGISIYYSSKTPR